jgi:hypothetical protein
MICDRDVGSASSGTASAKIFGKIRMRTASADKRNITRLLDQKPQHLSRWIDLSSPRAAQAIENSELRLFESAAAPERADEA